MKLRGHSVKKPLCPCIIHRAYLHELNCELPKVLKTIVAEVFYEKALQAKY